MGKTTLKPNPKDKWPPLKVFLSQMKADGIRALRKKEHKNEAY